MIALGEEIAHGPCVGFVPQVVQNVKRTVTIILEIRYALMIDDKASGKGQMLARNGRFFDG